VGANHQWRSARGSPVPGARARRRLVVPRRPAHFVCSRPGCGRRGRSQRQSAGGRSVGGLPGRRRRRLSHLPSSDRHPEETARRGRLTFAGPVVHLLPRPERRGSQGLRLRDGLAAAVPEPERGGAARAVSPVSRARAQQRHPVDARRPGGLPPLDGWRRPRNRLGACDGRPRAGPPGGTEGLAAGHPAAAGRLRRPHARRTPKRGGLPRRRRGRLVGTRQGRRDAQASRCRPRAGVR